MSSTRTIGRLRSSVIAGVRATLVTVEVHRGKGLPKVTIVGMPGTAVRESLERIHSACAVGGVSLEPRRTTINLAPASQPKAGSHLDLPIALGLLLADGKVDAVGTASWVCMGELGLDGAVRPVPGALPTALTLRGEGLRHMLLPAANLAEVAEVPGLEATGVRSLEEAVATLAGRPPPDRLPEVREPETVRAAPPDLAEIVGQPAAKRALELAAAGAHHLLMVGPPGAGKTLLARALPGLLPPMSFDEAVEASGVYSVVGLLAGRGLLTGRPFRAPHHSITRAGLIGGGRPVRPGEISLAHHGVLFLDELPEFRRGVLESLRQPLEEGSIPLFRGGEAVELPARFQLVAALNPCPCGQGPADDGCRCSDAQAEAYWRRISGPLLDRIDLCVHVPRPEIGAVIRGDHQGGEASATVRARVRAAREVQDQRLEALIREDDPGQPAPRAAAGNAGLPATWLERACRLAPDVQRRARRQAEALELSPRGWHRALRLARTAADLEGREEIGTDHLEEALHYRPPRDGRPGA